MRTNTIVRMMAVIALLTGMAAAAKYVAVVETEVDAASGASADINPAEVRQITAELRRQATENLPPGKYSVMTSETVMSMGGAVLEECAEENCVIALGSKIGADYIVRGTISKFQTRFTLTVELYETEDGTLIVTSEPVRSENIGELLDKASGACANMYKKFVDTRQSADAAKALRAETLRAEETQYAQETHAAGTGAGQEARVAAVAGGGKTEGKAGEGRKYDYYVAPKVVYMSDIPLGVDVEAGVVFGKGWLFLGIDGGHGEYGYDGNWNGGGFILGSTVNLGKRLQFLYGVTAGFWEVLLEYSSEFPNPGSIESINYYEKTDEHYVGAIVKLRWHFIELAYRGILGKRSRYKNTGDASSVINSQFMIGVYFETSKRSK